MGLKKITHMVECEDLYNKKSSPEINLQTAFSCNYLSSATYGNNASCCARLINFVLRLIFLMMIYHFNDK